MNYPSFTDHAGNIWTVVTIHIVKSEQWQAELECQTTGITKTKTFFFSVHTGMISQIDADEVMYSAPMQSYLNLVTFQPYAQTRRQARTWQTTINQATRLFLSCYVKH